MKYQVLSLSQLVTWNVGVGLKLRKERERLIKNNFFVIL